MTNSALPTVTVVGMVGGEVFGDAAREGLLTASVIVCSSRHQCHLPRELQAEVVELAGPLPPLLDRIAQWRDEKREVCVVASGDPGFYGIARTLGVRFGHRALRVFPAPSSVALAFASHGWSWEDALVVSAHGRPLAPAINAVVQNPKMAVLTSPSNTPESVGTALLERGVKRAVVVASRIGECDARVHETDLEGLAAGHFDPMSVVLLSDPEGRPGIREWGRDEEMFSKRGGMITKAEVRAVILSKLRLPKQGVLWDVGAGSGSVGIEAAGLCPGLQVFSIERDGEEKRRILANAKRFAASVTVIDREAPACLAELPQPDRIFIGGGGIPVLEACSKRLGVEGRLVTAHVVLEHALEARKLLGNMLQLRVDRAEPIASAGVRFVPLNPVFVSWGPT